MKTLNKQNLQPFQASGNGPKDKEQLKIYLFKNIYANSVKNMGACGI
jgi:hypothetical protein